MKKIVKKCTCCERTFSEAEWLTLQYVGIQDDFKGGSLELRNCNCGSTLAREIDVVHPE